MAVYTWTGRTRQGASKKGLLDARDKEGVIAQLRAQEILPISVKEKPKNIEDIFTFLQPKVTTKDLVVFTRQFAVMIDAGLPLVQCLQILGDNHENSTFKRVIGEVRNDVESGQTFAESLGRHPRVFDDLFVNLVAAGEVGGILDTIMNRLATQLEKADKLARQLKECSGDNY